MNPVAIRSRCLSRFAPVSRDFARDSTYFRQRMLSHAQLQLIGINFA